MIWKDIIQKTKKQEILIIVFSIVLVFLGVLLDFLVSQDDILLFVDNLNEFSLALLQIQATIITLTITIIALLSGIISDSYMGVSVSLFFLETKPYVLKQKRLICIEFIGLLCSSMAYLFALYNVLITNFVASILFVLLSVFEIYDIFKGRFTIYNEIESYVRYRIHNEQDYMNIGKNFIYDWKKLIMNQSEDEYESHVNVFFDLIISMLSNEKKTEGINMLSEDMALFLLNNDAKKCKIRGLLFVQNYYENIWIWINANQELAKTFEEQLSLITSVEREWYRSFDSIEAEYIEKEGFSFKSFSELIIRDSAWIGYSTDKISFEVKAVNNIARAIGRYINKQYQKGNLVTRQYWQNIIADRYGYFAYGLPDGTEDYYKNSLVSRDFNVVYGLLLSGQLDFVKESVFLDGINNIFKIDDISFAYKIMLVHCFMYYLAFRESTNCIDEELQIRLKELLTSNEIVNSVLHFYYKLAESRDILSDKIELEMEEYLQHYERFPKHSNYKSMIIEGVVRDYYLYVALIIERYSFQPDTLDKLLNTQMYYMYLIEANYSMLKKRFVDMHVLFEKKELTEEQSIKKSEEMLFNFVNVMKKKYKEYTIEETARIQKDYVAENIHDKIVNGLVKKIREKFEESFLRFQDKYGTIRTYEKIHIFREIEYTKWIRDDYLNESVDIILSNIWNWTIEELRNTYM